jgi:hypothetical protein
MGAAAAVEIEIAKELHLFSASGGNGLVKEP